VLILTGEVVTFDPKQPHVADGAVYIGDDELIAAVQPAATPAPAGFENVPRVDTGGVIYPGLIDLHNHIAYNVVALWQPRDRTTPYTSRTQWPDNAGYGPDIKVPTLTLAQLAGKAVIRYVETKAVIGGVTAIQGAARTYQPFDGWLVRNVEYETFGGQVPLAHQSVVTLHDENAFARAQRQMAGGSAFIYHLSEGTSPLLVREYTAMDDHQCVGPRLIGIHCTALGDDQFTDWEPNAGTVVWSPFSNLWLYHDTTKVDHAVEHGLRVCLGADWSPSGSKSLLGELKVADIWNRHHLNNAFTPRQLCEMATCNPADAVGWTDHLGRLRKGLRGDVLVTTRRSGDPYRNLISATEADVQLVAINGQPFYGTPQLMQAAGAQNADAIQVAGQDRRIVLVYSGVQGADIHWDEVLSTIEDVRMHPQQAHAQLRASLAVGEEPIRLRPDKPWDDPMQRRGRAAVQPPEMEPVLEGTMTLPPLDTLTPDAAYFDAIAASPILDGLLDDLAGYYPAPVPAPAPVRPAAV